MSRRTNGHHPEEAADREGADTANGAGETVGDAGKALSIETDGLQLIYSDGTEAVRDVSLSVPEGEFFGFLGANGAGKTTAIKVLATLLKPTNGEVFVNGFDAESEPREIRESIGYMAQEIGIDEELTARENLQFACAAYGVPRSERSERIEDLLDLVDLAAVADQRSESFSGGMQKRLDAATALVHRPPLVFLDEPTTGLDPKARNRLWEYFREINEEGTTIFLTTQYLEEADQLCERISVILDGEIVATGSPTELKRRVGGEILDIDVEADSESGDATEEDPQERAAAIARDSDLFESEATIEKSKNGISVTSQRARSRGTDLLVALRDGGLTVTGFNVRAPTLDDVFLAITDREEREPDKESNSDDEEVGETRMATDGGTGR
ncbi:daunorubicin ABC transporter ATP-binding protein [Halobacteriales archaeon QS_3_64_16]|nr:MAG: daunorubicin ABC transporter ATP-binding protein [Halobacteriales archaeon QS_3_64_16]